MKTFGLEVYRPATYTGPADVDQLGTVYLAYIPTGDVDDLAQQLVVKSSAFYTTLGSPYKDLAAHVVASFPVQAVAAGSTDEGSSTTSGGSSDGSSASSSSKTREDAIIGVVSSLGAITLIVLAFLIVRAVKQRRALAHRRLSDPPVNPGNLVGVRPEHQDFDRDSVGGHRRRSFYYAEDSLRGFEGQHSEPVDPNMMRERRPVNANMISTPVLRDNTMNW